jgi:hypothetical protein
LASVPGLDATFLVMNGDLLTNLDFGSDDIEATHQLVTATMKRCTKCGYAHLEQGNNLAEMCDRCEAALDVASRIDNLVQLQNVSLKLAKRITCDEEERQRFGQLIADTRPEITYTIRVDAISLMRSQLTREGPIYTRLSSVRLKE